MSESEVEVQIPLNFNTNLIQDNPNGWGPCDMPDKFKDMPYQPFSKSDRIGKISDWTGIGTQDKKFAGMSFCQSFFNSIRIFKKTYLC